jgi:hypothetical protein
MAKIKPCKCGGKPRLKRLKKGIFNFAEIRCPRCNRHTFGEYFWLSEENRLACIKEWAEENAEKQPDNP